MMRILHVVSVMDMGGMENYIMNLYRKIDRSKFQFDFLVHHGRRGIFEDEIEALGGRVYHTTLMDDFNLVKYLRDLDRLFSQNDYRIVHGHLGSTAFFYLGAAKRHGVSARILHSHCPGHPNTVKGYVKHVLFRLSPIHANVRLACSAQAGKYQFRNAAFEIVPNGIDMDRFRFDENMREDMRRRLRLKGNFVVGHVGRFYYEKNHAYLLGVFRELKKREPDAVLLLLGDGMLMEQTRAQARAMGLEASVRFMGVIGDCAGYYQAMDAFVLPSLYEALPLTGIEAQCAGLPCLFSEGVSREVKIDAQAAFLPIGSENVQMWVDKLLEIRKQGSVRRRPILGAERFDAGINAQKMVARYEALWERKI